MKKSFLISFLLTLFLVPTLKSGAINAQTGPEGTVSYQCTNFIRCSSEPENERCQPVGDDNVHTSRKWEHRSQIDLSSLTFPPNTDIYVTECLSIGEDLNGDGKAEPVCTTGDATLDKTLFCGDPNAASPSCNHLKILQDKKQYSLTHKESYGIFHLINGKYIPAPNLVIKSDANGKSLVQKVEWQSHTPMMVERRFHVWYRTPPPTPTPTIQTLSGTPPISPGVGGQQQSVLTFPAGRVPEEVPPPKDCQGQSWDPYGFVFDMKSLEPIPDADVLLSMKKPDGTFDSGYAIEQNFLISNPFVTAENGQFTFFVKDGDYSLIPTKAGYNHPKSDQQTLLLSNAAKVYSQAIYFSDSPAIQQRGAIQRRDIPLMPTDGVGKSYDLKILVEDVELSADGKLNYSGRISHPYAELLFEVCKKENGVETCHEPTVFNHLNGGPNKSGQFSITVDQKSLQLGEYYNRSFRKVDLTTLNLSSASPLKDILKWFVSILQPKSAYALETTDRAGINPIITYLEGFAYDSDGNLLPNVQVNILVPTSEVPVYSTQTDDKGYYKITSEYLPKIEYSIQYMKAVGKEGTKITTSQFLTQNERFITAEKVNPYLITTKENDPRKAITPTYIPPVKIDSISKEFKDLAPSITEIRPSTMPKDSTNSVFLIGAILLLVVATVGIIAVIYLYKKKLSKSEEM